METKVAALKTGKEEAAKELENRLAKLEGELSEARDGTAEAVSDLEEIRAMYNDTVSSLHSSSHGPRLPSSWPRSSF